MGSSATIERISAAPRPLIAASTTLQASARSAGVMAPIASPRRGPGR